MGIVRSHPLREGGTSTSFMPPEAMATPSCPCTVMHRGIHVSLAGAGRRFFSAREAVLSLPVDGLTRYASGGLSPSAAASAWRPRR